jgi:SLT domain-containing protein
MVPGMSGLGNMIGQVFGGFPQALGGLIAHGLVGIASLPGKALNAIMSLFGGGGNSSRLAAEAAKYAGHRYVWGGPANAQGGFDCSSFVNMLGGTLGLGLPGGFRAPSDQHGPNTGMWLQFGAMKRVAQAAMAMNDLYVNSHHMGVVTGPGTGFAARSTATGTGPQGVGSDYSILRFPGGGVKLPAWLEGIRGKVMGMFSKVGGFFGKLFGFGSSGGQGNPTAGVQQWAGIAQQVLNMFGQGQYLSALLAQMQTESGGNRAAQNNWDVNARMGTPSKGLMQVIDPTFNAYAGPFRSRGIWDPMANIYAAVAYALSRYHNLGAVWGHGHGYAKGGVVSEPVTGFGWRTGEMYHFAERGPELVSPLSGPGAKMGRSTAVVINVYPSAGMDERQLAAMVSRELAWAQAGGST